MVDRPTVLITGCNRGLGFSLAKALLSKNYSVLGGIRDGKNANSLPDGVVAVPLDVTNFDQIENAAELVRQQKAGQVVLINNAGTHISGPLEMADIDAAKRIFEVNFWGTLNMSRALLPIMRDQGSGHIISISSLSGLAALPGDGIYAASKHAVEAAMESLSHEVAHWNIKVSSVQPGAFQSNLIQGNSDNHTESTYQHLMPKKDSKSAQLPTADDIAQEIVSLLDEPTNELQIPVGNQAKLIACKLRSFDQVQRYQFIQKASGIS